MHELCRTKMFKTGCKDMNLLSGQRNQKIMYNMTEVKSIKK